MTTSIAKIENGVDRYSTIVAFNEHFYGMRDTSRSLLADVAFVPRVGPGGNVREANALAKLVQDFLADSSWSQTYGLSYTETMKLNYADWRRMQENINARKSHVIPET